MFYYCMSRNINCYYFCILFHCPVIFPYRQKMIWTSQHDVLLCREILVTQPFQHKIGSREKGQSWDKIATVLNSMDTVKFTVDQRAVRERFAKLEKIFKRKMAEELRASGISPEHTELDDAMESILDMAEAAQENMAMQDEKKRNVDEKERETAEGVRKRSMERLSETKERECVESGKKKRKHTDTTMVEYLREKNEGRNEYNMAEVEIKRREMERKLDLKEREQEEMIEMKRREQSLREKESEHRQKKEDKILEQQQLIIQMIQQQQQQQQMLVQQMQHQNDAIISLMKKLGDKIN